MSKKIKVCRGPKLRCTTKFVVWASGPSAHTGRRPLLETNPVYKGTPLPVSHPPTPLSRPHCLPLHSPQSHSLHYRSAPPPTPPSLMDPYLSSPDVVWPPPSLSLDSAVRSPWPASNERKSDISLLLVVPTDTNISSSYLLVRLPPLDPTLGLPLRHSCQRHDFLVVPTIYSSSPHPPLLPRRSGHLVDGEGRARLWRSGGGAWRRFQPPRERQISSTRHPLYLPPGKERLYPPLLPPTRAHGGAVSPIHGGARRATTSSPSGVRAASTSNDGE